MIRSNQCDATKANANGKWAFNFYENFIYLIWNCSRRIQFSIFDIIRRNRIWISWKTHGFREQIHTCARARVHAGIAITSFARGKKKTIKYSIYSERFNLCTLENEFITFDVKPFKYFDTALMATQNTNLLLDFRLFFFFILCIFTSKICLHR